MVAGLARVTLEAQRHYLETHRNAFLGELAGAPQPAVEPVP